ncbi:MAG: exodeoxyribonuclease VII small subunit [bacterium]
MSESKKRKDRTIQELKFREAMAQLEEVVNKMESGDLDLEAVVDYYEKGIKLAKHCHEKLHQSRGVIEKLTRENNILKLEPLADENEQI